MEMALPDTTKKVASASAGLTAAEKARLPPAETKPPPQLLHELCAIQTKEKVSYEDLGMLLPSILALVVFLEYRVPCYMTLRN